ncbi:4Fe-4S dicluster domain-containing protein [Alkaliphilus peptidifermentans]|uniref:NAD-dependent dihydropyrimidine dehydrogenase, PreA subunit n=1 Tax=Alkaliphilus peptidifermentans DSM 18978 TaxID=1120976 RepID=A0A1G5IJ17_9FIRM|nr:ferredoxin family protein [Alkaliphilus peptidifermentans]SCY76062.1 NAD-dependent dihydropyrimidine dehydrogenase, PreA subunit [Alkaliphilus peptidifermentans DSM 18978]
MRIEHLKSVLKYNMPDDLRNRIRDVLKNHHSNKDEIDSCLKETRERKSYTIPRKNIPWFPQINKGRCNNCLICYEFCPKQVYGINERDSEVYVKNPYSCVIACTGCVKKCLQDAINFPPKKDFEKYIYYK